jgi:diamine N-acetyltransferase
MKTDLSISLRPVQLSDASLILQWENDVDNWKVSDTKESYSIQDIISLIESLEDIEKAKQARYIIVNNFDHMAIGAVDVFNIDFENEEGSVGILVADKFFRNRSVGEKALQSLEELVIRDLGLVKLKASVQPDNHASLRLFEKLGYERKGEILKNDKYIDMFKFEKWLEK